MRISVTATGTYRPDVIATIAPSLNAAVRSHMLAYGVTDVEVTVREGVAVEDSKPSLTVLAEIYRALKVLQRAHLKALTDGEGCGLSTMEMAELLDRELGLSKRFGKPAEEKQEAL